MKVSMSTIVTYYLLPGAGNIGLMLYHNIDNLPSLCTDSNPQAVISIATDGLDEFFTFQALLFQIFKFGVLRGVSKSSITSIMKPARDNNHFAVSVLIDQPVLIVDPRDQNPDNWPFNGSALPMP